jgi:23S rRNA (uridine2552-2'-O)-methyltransferase
MNDPYVQRSKAEGYRSRAAYKLIEIDEKHHILKPGAADHRSGRGARRLVPGRRAGRPIRPMQSRVVGIDYLEMDPCPASASSRWISSTRRAGKS